MTKVLVMVSVLLLALLLAACAPRVAPAPASQAPSPVSAPVAAPAPTAAPLAPTKLAWELEWERALEAAKREGGVVYYVTGTPLWRIYAEAFGRRFGITTEFVSGASNGLSAKILAERRAGIYLVDGTVLGFSSPATILKPAGVLDNLDKVLLLPELTDPKEIQKIWLAGELEWLDKDHTMLAYTRYVKGAILVNTELVRPGEIKAYRDLLDPKWKGKIIMYDPTLGSSTGITTVQGVTNMVGWDYWKKFAEQKPLLTREERLVVEWVARGKYTIALAFKDTLVVDFRELGTPIEIVSAEEGGYTTSGGHVLTLLKNAPHPNSAKLFINWVFSKEGQSYFLNIKEAPSLRTDVSNEGIWSGYIPDPKKRYFRINTEEMTLALPEVTKTARDIFGKLVQ